MAEPEKVRAGSTVQWSRTASDYSDASWTGKYTLNAEGLPEIEISTTNDEGTFTVDAKPTETTNWNAAQYAWVFQVTDGTDIHIVDTGTIEVIALTATGDDLLDAQSYLSAAETELAARASGKPSSYSIADRSLTRASSDELMAIISYWRRRVNELKNERAVERGRGNRRMTYARFRY